ncbi:MAG: IclR family transcriptional regulator [Magnetospirillum sp.]|nr:IclR family transcriptional regulator [Magnetospirillum sp.]
MAGIGDVVDSDEEESKDRMFVTALARGLDVLRSFTSGEALLGNQEISKRTGLPKPTVCRMTHTLTKLGYLRFNSRLEKYQLGTAVLSLGYSALAGMDIRQIARPFMQEMANATNASVSLGSRDRTSMIYVESCRGQGPVTLRLDVGSRIPLATTAMGRAYLATIAEEERSALMDELKARHAEDWPAISRGIEQALKDYADFGFTMSTGEWQPEIHAVGRAIALPDNGGILAFNCGGAAFLMPRDKLESDYGPQLLETVRRVEAALSRP